VISAELSEDGAFLASVRRIADEVASLHADDVDRDARFPSETVAALREAGALGAYVPARLGGRGVSLAAVAAACQQLGRSCASSAMIFAMHQVQVGTIGRHLDGAPWFESYLREVADQQRLIASVTSEVGTGGDIGRSVAAITVGRDGLLLLEKQSPTVSYGAHCDDFLTTVRRADTGAPGDQAMVLHRIAETELEQVGTWDTLGMRGTCSPGFVLRARFAPEQVLPTPFGEILTDSMVPLSHILWSFVWLGIASEAFERGRAFARASARRRPGEPVPAARGLSRVMAELALLRAEVHSGLDVFLAATGDRGREGLRTMTSVLRFNNLKLAASEQAPRVCSGILEIVGIDAYRNDSPFGVGRHLRDALSARLMVANDRLYETDAKLLLITKEA
jgi:acyl-CoA dehydrogenase